MAKLNRANAFRFDVLTGGRQSCQLIRHLLTALKNSTNKSINKLTEKDKSTPSFIIPNLFSSSKEKQKPRKRARKVASFTFKIFSPTKQTPNAQIKYPKPKTKQKSPDGRKLLSWSRRSGQRRPERVASRPPEYPQPCCSPPPPSCELRRCLQRRSSSKTPLSLPVSIV